MGWMAAAVIGSSLLGSRSSSNAADSASQASREASAASIAEQRRQYDQSRADYAPYLAAGTDAVNQLAADLRPGGRFASTTPFDFQYDQNTDPGTAFRLSEGVKALDRSAASRGGLLSGATLKGIQRYGQDLGSQEFQNAFNRYTTGFNADASERNQLYNRYAGVAGTGQQAVKDVTSQGANAASNIGNAYMTSAANTGNAAMAAAGQRNSAYGGAANALGRMYGGYGRGSDPYSNAAMANQQYGAGNVYGYGGGGYTSTEDAFDYER